MKLYKYEVKFPQSHQPTTPNAIVTGAVPKPAAVRKVSPLGVYGIWELDMPIGAKILTTDFPRGVPTLWALVDEDADTEVRTFTVFATGEDVTDEWDFLGTNKMSSGLVWHLFEKKRAHQ